MFRIILVIMIACTAVLLPACQNSSGTSDIPQDPSLPPTVFGTVVSPMGLGLPNVSVHYIPHLHWNDLPFGLTKPAPYTSIEFVITHRSIVSMAVFRLGTNELIATLLEHDTLDAGYHTVGLDGATMTNGIYYLKWLIDGKLQDERRLFFLRAIAPTDAGQLVNAVGICRTDPGGRFQLPWQVFGIGIRFPMSYDPRDLVTDYTITDTVDMVLIAPGRQPVIRTIVIDTSHITTAAFVME